MDYRYETKDDARDLHKRRRAFIIRNGIVEFLPQGSDMSHYEYCEKKGISKEEFNGLTRGYFLNGNLVFYKDNFVYDKPLIDEALTHINEIAQFLSQNTFNIYFGHVPQEDFRLDLFYGTYGGGKVSKND